MSRENAWGEYLRTLIIEFQSAPGSMSRENNPRSWPPLDSSVSIRSRLDEPGEQSLGRMVRSDGRVSIRSRLDEPGEPSMPNRS